MNDINAQHGPDSKVQSETQPKCCAKCSCIDLLLVEAERGGYGSGNVIQVDRLLIWSSVKVNRFVCMSCRFCEEWISSPADLEALRRSYGPGSSRATRKLRREKLLSGFNSVCHRLGRLMASVTTFSRRST